MSIKRKIKKVLKSRTLAAAVGVAAGAGAVLAYYDCQTLLHLNTRAKYFADAGGMVGFDVNGTQYLLAKCAWK